MMLLSLSSVDAPSAERGLRKDRQLKKIDPFCSIFLFENKSKELVRC